METQLTKGFGLLETVITTALITLIALAIIQATASITRLANHTEQQISEYWLRQNPRNQGIKHKVTTYVYADTNNDGNDDTWIPMAQLSPSMHYSISKTIVTHTWPNQQTERFVVPHTSSP